MVNTWFIERSVIVNPIVPDIDQFGKEVWLSKVDDWHFQVTVSVAVSPQFFAWVFGLGNYVTITAPDNVVKQMKEMLDKVSKRYGNEKA